MKNAKIVLSKIAHSERLKSFRTSAALIVTTLMLVAAATTVATAQTYTDLFNFDGTHGWNPWGPLAQRRDGNLYGTTLNGGANNLGVVFKVTPNGRLKVLHSFGGADGSNPVSGLTLGTGGNFYGTTQNGGARERGTIFKITGSGSLTTLYSFTGGKDGHYPYSPPIQGTDGNFYGTTAGTGTAYEVTASGTFTLLHALSGTSWAPLFQGTDGNFYGTIDEGGKSGHGAVFKMTPKGTLTIVYNFDGTHGAGPVAPVIQGSDGDFYGTTAGGGSYEKGVVFKLTPQGALTVLHEFGDPNYPNDGLVPWAGLVQATDGNFYGLTAYGGTAVCDSNVGCGVIFQITSAGAYSILYDLGSAGYFPQSTPMQHTNGKIYGVVQYGGTSNVGVVYSFDVGLGPFVRTVPMSRKVGKSVGILGGGLTSTSNVSFNGTPAAFTVVSDTYLTATVPSGATTGSVTVTTPGGTLTSNQPFRVTPMILSFTPTSGSVGTSVTITGNSLTQTTKVAFGGVQATSFTVNSDTQVTATVPTGAKTGNITITTAGGWASSPGTFTVTQ